MKLAEIRTAFIQYFIENGHTEVKSSSLVPNNDPTLLFTNAGMVQFKDVFLGQEKRPYTKAVSVQRCLRAGGKHNDLENVGYTARHHTFFEMLGNFSFGDYFKRDAINYAWDFLTNVLKLPVERLWVTVYEKDDEAADIWLNEIKVSPKRFSRCGEKDNFWSMGDTGPCGPCSEIFYDHGDSIPGGPPGSAGADLDRYIEIWNMVFMQYNRDATGELHPLPQPSVDTGMGLERIAAVMQGVHNNYTVDLFESLISEIAALGQNIPIESSSLKVIADHIRATVFLIVDGVTPSNEGRGYVLRRIIRRAVRHGEKLGLVIPFFYKVVPVLVKLMQEAYPEISGKSELIAEIIKKEEEQFNTTLTQGLAILKAEIEQVEGNILPGSVAFKLYDTYGFPVDLTEDVAREHSLHVAKDEFEFCMQKQRSSSREASQFQTSANLILPTDIKASTFEGYEQDKCSSRIVALLDGGQNAKQLVSGQQGAIILDHTPFYAESGGQVGDVGSIKTEDALFTVHDTQKVGNVSIHYGKMVSGSINVNDTVIAEVDSQRRNEIRLNHSATHLLHAALKAVLGNSVEQKGSLVEAHYARFDFAYTGSLTQAQIMAVEKLVNDKIRANMPVDTAIMDIDAAKSSGAVALFGEKYCDKVRVLSMGDFSKELCGGTHVKRTGDIGLFKITSEYGVAQGVRRIELLTGGHALKWVEDRLEILTQCGSLLNAPVDKIKDKLLQLSQAAKQNEKEITRLENMLAAQASDTLLSDVEQIGEIPFLLKSLEVKDMGGLRTQLDQIRSKLENGIIVLYTIADNKLSVVASVSKSLIDKAPSAVDFVRHLCGKGGGRPDMAQGGGEIPDNFQERLQSIHKLVAK